MTEHNDDLMNRLAAADPIDPAELPSAADPAAQDLLRATLQRDPADIHVGTSTPQTSLTESDSMNPQTIQDAPAEPVVDIQSARRAPRRNRGWLVGAAAAVLLLVGGLLVFSPDNTPPAVAAVQNAAQAAADADTGRITTTFTASGQDGEESGELSGSFEASYAGDDFAITATIDTLVENGVSASIPIGELPATEARIVDGVVYANFSGQWIAVDTDGMLGTLVSDIVDPRSVLETVQELTETEEVGSATIDGVETTHYQSIVDLADESLSRSGWMGYEGVPIESDGEVTIDLYVDDAGLLRQLDVSGDLSESAPSGETGSGTFAVSTRFHDLGGDITVEAPEGAEMIDMMDGLFGDEDN